PLLSFLILVWLGFSGLHLCQRACWWSPGARLWLARWCRAAAWPRAAHRQPPEVHRRHPNILILYVRRLGLGMEDVRVSYGPQHARQPHPDLDVLIDQRWEEACAANPRLFAGPKFRLRRIAWADGGSSVELDLGPTTYKEYLGTNRLAAEERLRLERDGERDCGDRAAHLSNALGCEALLITADDQVVLLRRSGAVATHSGLWNGPSGHPEPERAVPERAGAERAGGAGAAEPSEEAERLVLRELFDSVLQEVEEETNVPRGCLGPPLLIGCMADGTGKPDVLFLVRTSLDAAAVRSQFEKGAAEGWESDRIAFRPAASLAAELCGGPLRLTAVTRAAWACLLELRRAAAGEGAGA
ncbi:unnamed protein product, partial [Prorocentrum cordatum]